MAIILASASPRRQELLRQVGCDFTVIVSDVAEDNGQKLPPTELAMSLAAAKAFAVVRQVSADDIVIGADTIVVLAGQVYGKPQDGADARRMLTELAGKEHEVITGLAVAVNGKIWTGYSATVVNVRQLTANEIESYLATGEPMDKAGAYAIQGIGALLIEGIRGCYANVVGLPLVKLNDLLRQAAGVSLL